MQNKKEVKVKIESYHHYLQEDLEDETIASYADGYVLKEEDSIHITYRESNMLVENAFDEAFVETVLILKEGSLTMSRKGESVVDGMNFDLSSPSDMIINFPQGYLEAVIVTKKIENALDGYGIGKINLEYEMHIGGEIYAEIKLEVEIMEG